jgi:hypothetical protein
MHKEIDDQLHQGSRRISCPFFIRAFTFYLKGRVKLGAVEQRDQFALLADQIAAKDCTALPFARDRHRRMPKTIGSSRANKRQQPTVGPSPSRSRADQTELPQQGG